MRDLKDLLEPLSSLEVRDHWNDVRERSPGRLPPEPRRSRAGAYAAAALAVVLVIAIAVVLVPLRTEDRTPGLSPGSPPRWLVERAYEMAYASGDITPTSAAWVLSDAQTIAPALGLDHGDPDLQQYLVVMEGDFTGYWAKGVPRADLPIGRILAFAVDPRTHETTDSSIGEREVSVAGLQPFELPDPSDVYGDQAGWRMAVPPGWRHGNVLGPDTGQLVGGFIASTDVVVVPGRHETLPQATSENFPNDAIALVVSAVDEAFGDAAVIEPPISIDDVSWGSSAGGVSEFGTVYVRGNGATFGVALRIGLRVSPIDRAAAAEALASLTFAKPASTGPTGATSPVAQTRCVAATTSGDFDGEGTIDRAEFVLIVSGHVSCVDTRDVFRHLISQEVDIAFGSGQTLDQPFSDCQPCLTGGEVFAATDLDGDRRDELAIDVGPGAALNYVEFYRVDPGGIRPLVVADPGGPPYVQPGPAILGGGFDSGQQSPIMCQVKADGTREVISVHAENLTGPITGPWHIHSTTMVLEGDRLVVTSTSDSDEGLSMTSEVFQDRCR